MDKNAWFFIFVSIVILELLLYCVFIFSFLILIKGDCGRNGYNDDSERRVMSYTPELSYRMAILSAVTYDQSHPQHCLDQYLPAAKFQLQTVFTKKLWFRRQEVLWIYRGFACFASDGRRLSRNWMYATTYWWIARVHHYPTARFSQWQSSGLFQDGLWSVMAVHGADSESSSFKESLLSGLGYRAFSWCFLSVLGECLACLLQHRSTSKHHLIHIGSPRVGDYKDALQHDQLVNNSWRVVNFDDVVPHLPPLILPSIKSGPYHHGVEVFYSEKGHQCAFCTQGMLRNTARRGQDL